MVRKSQILGQLIVTSMFTLPSSIALANAYDNEWENVQGKEANSNNLDQQEAEAEVRELSREQGEEAEKLRIASSRRVRRFHEVLDELLAEFGYDVRLGQLKDLKNISIRKVQVSDALPSTYRSYVELLVAERIRENSRVRLVSCVPCKSKTSRLVEGKLLITSPTTNTARMQAAADQLGVDNFMDVILVYHTTHMVLAMQVFNTQNQEMLWARTYNSETVRSRYQKLAIDYKQVEKSRPGEDYQPDFRYMIGLGGGIIPNVNADSDDSGMISFIARGTEKFDNRRHEFGLHMNMYIRKSSILGDQKETSSSSDSESGALAGDDVSSLEPWNYALALYGIYGRHFVASLESYNNIRHGLNVGIGFLAATAYITPSIRAGWDVFFGKRFSTNLAIVGLSPSTVFVGDEPVSTQGGVGGELTISVNF